MSLLPKKQLLRSKYRPQIFLIGAILLFYFIALPAYSADLKLSFNKNEVSVGDTVSARVYLASPGEATNAVSGVISFDPKKLQVSSLSKSGSVVNLWVEEPGFSNTRGQVSFEGAILNPGFSGSAGTIININFKARAEGNVSLGFINGSILANDGQGTSILKKLGTATLVIKNKIAIEEVDDKEIEEIPKVVEAKKVSTIPELPIIVSDTHPSSDEWYKSNKPRFSWQLEDNIVGVSYLFNQEKSSSPEPKSLGLLKSYSATNELEDGIWYFHLRLKNEKGWSNTSHYKIKVDSNAPYSLIVKERKLESLDYKTTFDYQAIDELSGIKQYEFVINNREPEIVPLSQAERGVYETPTLFPGSHQIIIRAVDWAGNTIEQKLIFEISSPLTSAKLYRWGDFLIVALSILIPLLLLILALIYIFIIGWHKLKCLKLSLRKEVDEVEQHITEAFDYIREDLAEQVKLIEKTKGKRKLSLLEAKIMRRLRSHLKETEKYLKEDLEDITNKIK